MVPETKILDIVVGKLFGREFKRSQSSTMNVLCLFFYIDCDPFTRGKRSQEIVLTGLPKRKVVLDTLRRTSTGLVI